MNILATYTEKKVLGDETVDELSIPVFILQFLGVDVGGLKAVCAMPDGTIQRLPTSNLVIHMAETNAPSDTEVDPSQFEMQTGKVELDMSVPAVTNEVKKPWWKRGN